MVKKQSFFSRVLTRLRLADDQSLQDSEESVTIQRDPRGSSGTLSFSGYPSEEYLSQLRGRERADVFDEMRRSDTQIKMCLSGVKNPLRAATFEIEPGSIEGQEVTPEAKQDADLIRHILLSDMDQPFASFIGEAASVADFGHAVFEITHKVVVDHPIYGSYNGLRSLGFRSPRTLERWNLDPETGKLASVTQYAYGDLDRQVDIPAEFLLVMNLEREGSNFEGISLLRPCYGPWKRKNLYLKLNAIGIEKFAVPTPTVTVPSGKENSPEYSMLTSALEAYTSHEKGYLTVPAGWTVEWHSNTYDPEKVEASCDNEDTRIAKAFLCNLLELGMKSVGSFSLSENMIKFMTGGILYVGSQICEPINMKLIPELVRVNRGPRPVYPKLKITGIDDNAGKELAEMYKLFVESKLLTPQDADEQSLRKRLKLGPFTGQGVRQLPAPVPGFSGGLSERIRLSEAKRKQLNG